MYDRPSSCPSSMIEIPDVEKPNSLPTNLTTEQVFSSKIQGEKLNQMRYYIVLY